MTAIPPYFRSRGADSSQSGTASRDLALGARRRVVLAQSDAPLRAILAAALRAHGMEIIEAGDGGALRAALWPGPGQGQGQGAPPVLDAIVCDTHLDGLEDAGLALQPARCPLILLAGGNLLAAADTAIRLGAAVVLRLPLDLERLRDEVMKAA